MASSAALLERLIGGRGVVGDQHVQPALLALDAVDEGAHLRGVQVVARHRDALPAGGGDQLGGLFDGLRTADLRAALAGAPPGRIDGGPGGAQLHGDAPARAPRRPGDQRDLSVQLSVQRVLHGHDASTET